MKPVPHGEPYAGKLHVRFDEGAGVPCGGAPLCSTPSAPSGYWSALPGDEPIGDAASTPMINRGYNDGVKNRRANVRK